MHDFFSGLSQSQRNIEQWLYLEEWLFPSFLADHYSWLATRLMNPRVSLVPSNKFFFFWGGARFIVIVNRGEGLSPSWLLLSSWRPRRCSAPLSSSSRGYVSPPFSWWTWGPACPWRPWAAPWLVARKGRSHTPPGSCPTRIWCVWWDARGGGCASACPRSWSPCDPCWGPQPWGSAEPWLFFHNGCRGGRRYLLISF